MILIQLGQIDRDDLSTAYSPVTRESALDIDHNHYHYHHHRPHFQPYRNHSNVSSPHPPNPLFLHPPFSSSPSSFRNVTQAMLHSSFCFTFLKGKIYRQKENVKDEGDRRTRRRTRRQEQEEEEEDIKEGISKRMR